MFRLPQSRLFWGVSIGHLANDATLTITPILLAFISINLFPVSAAEIGLITGLAALIGALTQPIAGWLGGGHLARGFTVGGVAWTITFSALALWAAEQGSMSLMVVGFIVASIGSGMFHPVGATYAAEGSPFAASNVAYFFMLGQLGSGMGPIIVGLLLNNAASTIPLFMNQFPSLAGQLMPHGSVLSVYWWFAFAMPMVLFMGLVVPRYRVSQPQTAEALSAAKPSSPPQKRAVPYKAFILLLIVVALRSLSQPGAVNFIPLLFQEKGWSPAEYGLITSLFWIASGVAGVIFGNLADHYDRRKVIAFSLIAAAPALFLLPLTNGFLALTLAVLAGGLSGGSQSVIVVMAQGLMPQSKAFASGIILGLIFGTGALGSLLIGLISDASSLTFAFQFVAVAITLASILTFALPAKHGQPQNIVSEHQAEALPSKA